MCSPPSWLDVEQFHQSQDNTHRMCTRERIHAPWSQNRIGEVCTHEQFHSCRMEDSRAMAKDGSTDGTLVEELMKVG